jgi:hypothetical protein
MWTSVTPRFSVRRIAILLVLQSCALQLTLCAATSLYVAPTGDDTNSCVSIAEPCQTINGALAKAGAGDTIYVAIGTYTGTALEVVDVQKASSCREVGISRLRSTPVTRQSTANMRGADFRSLTPPLCRSRAVHRRERRRERVAGRGHSR